MRNFAPLLAAFAAFAAPVPSAALTASSTDDCLADIGALDGAIAHMSAGTPDAAPVSILDLLPDSKRPVFEDGYCVIHDFRTASMGSGVASPTYFASALRWQADWADGSRPMPPNRLVLEVPKFGVSYGRTDDPADELGQILTYHSNLMTDLYPNEFRLELGFDPQTDLLEIRQLAVQNAYANRVEFSATLRDADLDGIVKADWSGVPPLDKLTPITIQAADMTFTNNGYFEAMAMSWLGFIYPRLGNTPAAAVAAAQGIGRDQIAQVPDDLVPADSKAALTAFIDSIPSPVGTLRLRLDAPNGIQPSLVAATQMMVANASWTSFSRLVKGASLDAEWTPAAPQRLLPPLTAD